MRPIRCFLHSADFEASAASSNNVSRDGKLAHTSGRVSVNSTFPSVMFERSSGDRIIYVGINAEI